MIAEKPSRPFNPPSCRVPIRSRRNAFTFAELIVCAGLLLVGMSFVSVSVIRNGRQWKQLEQYQLAVDELERVSEELAGRSIEEVARDFSAPVQPSELARNRLPDCRLWCEFSPANGQPDSQSDLGLKRQLVERSTDLEEVFLAITWTRPGNPPPLVLSVWVAREVE